MRSIPIVLALVTVLGVSAFVSISSPPTAEAKGVNLTVCRVTAKNGLRAYVEKTGKYAHLSHGAQLTLVSREIHQGVIVVKAMIGGKSTRVEVQDSDTNCRVG